jgi:hypothetical protein
LITITGYFEDGSAKTDERHAHNEESHEDDKDDNNGDHSPSKPASDTNFARRIDRIWLDVHNLIPRTDPGLFIPGIPTDYHEVEEDFAIGNKRSHTGDAEDGADTPGPSKSRHSQEATICSRWR